MKNLILKSTTTFKEAISLLDSNGNGFLAIVDDNNKLIGILTDGDVRRAILHNKTELQDIINKKPFVVQENVSKRSIILKLKGIRKKHMPIVDENMILKDIFVLDNFYNISFKSNWIVIMAGGLGTRLGELTKETPKPMLKVGNKPILELIIDRFIDAGFNKFYISVNYKKDIIKEYFKDGMNFGIQIKYIEEETRLGTCGALSLIQDELSEPIIVSNGDVLTNIDFDELLTYHYNSQAIATMCTREYEHTIPYGVIEVNDNNDIKIIKEKPKINFLINTGVYVLNPVLIQKIPKNKFFDMPDLFKTLIVEKANIKNYNILDYWIDIGHKRDYQKANEDSLVSTS